MFRLSNPGKVGTLMKARKAAHRRARRCAQLAAKVKVAYEDYMKLPRSGGMVLEETAKANLLKQAYEALEAAGRAKADEAGKLLAALNDLEVFGAKKAA